MVIDILGAQSNIRTVVTLVGYGELNVKHLPSISQQPRIRAFYLQWQDQLMPCPVANRCKDIY
jgi:hypothetical protein